MFFYVYKVLFLGFLQFNGNFVDAQNNSKCRDWAPLIDCVYWTSNLFFWTSTYQRRKVYMLEVNLFQPRSICSNPGQFVPT